MTFAVGFASCCRLEAGSAGRSRCKNPFRQRRLGSQSFIFAAGDNQMGTMMPLLGRGSFGVVLFLVVFGVTTAGAAVLTQRPGPPKQPGDQVVFDLAVSAPDVAAVDLVLRLGPGLTLVDLLADPTTPGILARPGLPASGAVRLAGPSLPQLQSLSFVVAGSPAALQSLAFFIGTSLPGAVEISVEGEFFSPDGTSIPVTAAAEFNVVPLPPAVAMFGAALAGLGFWRTRRRR